MHIWHGARRVLALAVAGVAVIGALAAFSAARHHSPAATHPVVSTAKNSKLHERILVAGSSGLTLYHLKTESAAHITCTGSCAKLWPPLIVHSSSAPKAGHGVHGTLTVVKRPDGKLQAAFNGMPLYTFSRDQKRGDANGQGFMNVWFALPASGGSSSSGSSSSSSSSTPAPTPTKTPSSSSGGYGY